jgi:LEA14-like dessication related protein
MKRFVVAFAVVLVAFALSACAKPKPPQLTPKEVIVTDVSLRGFDMRVKMDAFNPNGFDIAVRAITAHVMLGGTQDLGTVTVTQPMSLPAKAHALIDVPLNVKWMGLVGLGSLAQAQKPIPYTVDGVATFGGESLNVDLPFKLAGEITPEQIRQAAAKSLQGIPALQAIPGLVLPR